MAWHDDTFLFPWLKGPRADVVAEHQAARQRERQTSAKLFPVGSTDKVLMTYSIEPRHLSALYRNASLPPPSVSSDVVKK